MPDRAVRYTAHPELTLFLDPVTSEHLAEIMFSDMPVFATPKEVVDAMRPDAGNVVHFRITVERVETPNVQYNH